MLGIRVGEDSFEFAADVVVTVGRGETCDVVVDDHRVSRLHLEIRCLGGTWRVTDSDSANGTYLDGDRIHDLDLLRPVDLLLADPADGVRVRIEPDADLATITGAHRDAPVVITIGRASDNDVVLDDERASRYHAELVVEADRAAIVDRGSANGTSVNGTTTDRSDVAVGDRIEVGDTTLRVVRTTRGIGVEVVAQGATVHGDRTSARPTAGSETGALGLTSREQEILALVAGGASDRDIGEALFISVATVRSHLDRIDGKTGYRRRADLTRLAIELGIEPRMTSSGA